MKLLTRDMPVFRANFHTHTTDSDGKRTPAESMKMYREAGYDILSLTEHRKMLRHEDIPEGLLLIPGLELDFLLPGQAVHLLGLGVDPKIVDQWDPKGSIQQAIDDIRACGGLAVLAHPAWSMNDTQTMANMKGLSAVEVWNSVSAPPYNADRADSAAMLDALWSNYPDSLLPVMANDDTHFYGSEFASGWNMVQAEELTVPAVMEALRQGRFYATRGPQLLELEQNGDELRVVCSPASSIVFYSNKPWVGGRAHCGEGLTEAVYHRQADERFVRVQVTDAQGRSAWSAPVDFAK